MDLDAYFDRIQFTDTPRVDLATLSAIHRQHALHIPYENIDVQLGRPLDFDEDRIFNKLVHAKRGGWCYEMNGLMGRAYEEIGFEVTRMSGGVMREARGDDALANHLVLKVELDGVPYIADVGLGDGLREPIPLREGTIEQGGLTYRLSKQQDGYWRFYNHELSYVTSFDFMDEPASTDALAAKCQELQTSPESPFVMALIVQIFTPDAIHIQLGKTWHVLSPGEGKTSGEVASAEELQARLADIFGITEDISTLWDSICAAHERYFSSDNPGD